MRLLCFGYRTWSLNIYKRLQDLTPHHMLIVQSQGELDEKLITDFKPDYILFYGWSRKVPKALFDKFECLMLHPSNLPKYRGGSPLQNQILDGLENTSLCIFKMAEELDAGPIYARGEISLKGSIKDIFSRLECVGFELTTKILKGDFEPQAQNEKDATYCRRRSPEQSELTLTELSNSSGVYLYNKIRSLNDPYPNAFIRTKDGRKLLIKDADLE